MEMASNAMTVAWSGEDELAAAVRDHSRLVFRVCYSVLRNHHDAEDATQETFLRLMRYRGKWQEARDPRRWLVRVAWRVALDRRPRGAELGACAAREESADAAEQVPSPAAAADEILAGAQLRGQLERLIAALPKKLRHPLVLSTLQELEPPDVAAALGISEAAVRSRVFRARQILKERLHALTQDAEKSR